MTAQPTHSFRCDKHLNSQAARQDLPTRHDSISYTPFILICYVNVRGFCYSTSRNCPAAISGVMSRCGIPSISNPTRNLRTVAERSKGG